MVALFLLIDRIGSVNIISLHVRAGMHSCTWCICTLQKKNYYLYIDVTVLNLKVFTFSILTTTTSKFQISVKGFWKGKNTSLAVYICISIFFRPNAYLYLISKFSSSRPCIAIPTYLAPFPMVSWQYMQWCAFI